MIESDTIVEWTITLRICSGVVRRLCARARWVGLGDATVCDAVERDWRAWRMGWRLAHIL